MMKKLLMIVVAVMIAVMIGGTAHAELIVAYGFNGNLADSSGNGYDGIGDGAIAYAADVPEGLSGQSLVLDGDSTVDAPISAVNPFDGSGDFSIAVWFKTEQAGLIISSARDSTSENHSLAVFVRDNGTIAADNFYVNAANSSGGFNDGQWHHLVVLYTSAEEVYDLVIDGEFNGSNGFNPAIPNIVEDTVLIGNSLNTTFPIGDESETFVGNLKDLAIFNHVLSEEEIADLMANGLSPLSASEPDPSNGETVKAANPLTLSWTNLEPTDPGDLVYVDVWWGTEPNALDLNKIVPAESVDFKDVDSSALDTYYWRVDSYVNGADDINEPNRVEGQLWSYTTVSDLAPTVEIVTPDQMTWSGEGVPLDATVTDDGESATTIEWSADLPNGISAAFDPGDEVDTTVTLTKVPYSEALIVNAGFEDPVLADGASQLASGISGWTEGYYPAGETGWADWDELCGAVNPDAAYGYGGAPYAGENIAWCKTYPGYEQGLSQTLPEVLAAETQYDLSAMVSTPELITPVTYRIELLAGETILATDGNIVSPEVWTLASLVHTTGVSPAQLGEPLTIRLFVGDAAFGFDVNFDDVVLTADPPFPARTGVETVTMTVAVIDGGNPTPNTASIEIDVYDDACHMARVGLGRSAITDFNANCITGLEELVVMVGAWLDDYSSTGPADK